MPNPNPPDPYSRLSNQELFRRAREAAARGQGATRDVQAGIDDLLAAARTPRQQLAYQQGERFLIPSRNPYDTGRWITPNEAGAVFYDPTRLDYGFGNLDPSQYSWQRSLDLNPRTGAPIRPPGTLSPETLHDIATTHWDEASGQYVHNDPVVQAFREAAGQQPPRMYIGPNPDRPGVIVSDRHGNPMRAFSTTEDAERYISDQGGIRVMRSAGEPAWSGPPGANPEGRTPMVELTTHGGGEWPTAYPTTNSELREMNEHPDLPDWMRAEAGRRADAMEERNLASLSTREPAQSWGGPSTTPMFIEYDDPTGFMVSNGDHNTVIRGGFSTEAAARRYIEEHEGTEVPNPNDPAAAVRRQNPSTEWVRELPRNENETFSAYLERAYGGPGGQARAARENAAAFQSAQNRTAQAVQSGQLEETPRYFTQAGPQGGIMSPNELRAIRARAGELP